MILSTREIFKRCYGKYALAAVNVWSLEQIHALFAAAEKAGAPFIVQMTPAARNYAGADMLMSMIYSAAKTYEKTIFAIHLDHGNEEHAMAAIDCGGYHSIMIDASHDPYEINVQTTKNIVKRAHQHKITVEAELGILSGVEDDISIEEKQSKYTSPDQVMDFVTRTGCDSLAVAVGTSHGAYKFSGGDGLQFDILTEIQKRLPGFPLVLHGGSAVDTEEILRINRAGGNLGIQAKGVSPEELQRSIEYGICKVNIATDARLIWTRIHREFFRDEPEAFDPIVPGKTFMDAFEKFLIEKFELLHANNRYQEFK